MVDNSFDGRIVLVTGGGTGIGAGITTLFRDRGASVVICQPTQQQADERAQALSVNGRSVTGVGADLASASACHDLIERCIELHGHVDVLVNNAAITGPPAVGDILEFGDEKVDELVDVNLKAPFRCGRNAARHMRASGGGVIINIASVGAYAAQHRATVYVATKAGVAGLTRGMAFELAPYGIRVVAVAPGDIDLQPSSAAPGTNPYDEQPREWWSKRSPLGRRGTPADIARTVLFLASDDAGYITGETLLVDGGWLTY